MKDNIDSFIDKNKRLAITGSWWTDTLDELIFHFEDDSLYFLSESEIKRMAEMGVALRWIARTEEIE